MKKFTTEEIRDLFNQVRSIEISFFEMTKVINERIDQSEVNEYKDGDFLNGLGCIFILHKQIDDYSAQYHVLYVKNSGMLLYDKAYSQLGGIDKIRLATYDEKQELLDALVKEGKRWNAEKLCIEDIPVRKFKKGDKVRVKEGISSKTHDIIYPSFVEDMDDLIGKTMTVNRYTDLDNFVECEETEYAFLEEWLELYVEELKKGDLVIFWDEDKKYARINIYDEYKRGYHFDIVGYARKNAIKFGSKEQYERLIKGEI